MASATSRPHTLLRRTDLVQLAFPAGTTSIEARAVDSLQDEHYSHATAVKGHTPQLRTEDISCQARLTMPPQTRNPIEGSNIAWQVVLKSKQTLLKDH